jgi:hypothetical protein
MSSVGYYVESVVLELISLFFICVAVLQYYNYHTIPSTRLADERFKDKHKIAFVVLFVNGVIGLPLFIDVRGAFEILPSEFRFAAFMLILANLLAVVLAKCLQVFLKVAEISYEIKFSESRELAFKLIIGAVGYVNCLICGVLMSVHNSLKFFLIFSVFLNFILLLIAVNQVYSSNFYFYFIKGKFKDELRTREVLSNEIDRYDRHYKLVQGRKTLSIILAVVMLAVSSLAGIILYRSPFELSETLKHYSTNSPLETLFTLAEVVVMMSQLSLILFYWIPVLGREKTKQMVLDNRPLDKEHDSIVDFTDQVLRFIWRCCSQRVWSIRELEANQTPNGH